MTAPTTDPTRDRALKAHHRAMWAFGDYPHVASDLIAELGPALVAAAGVRGGDRVLDVAAGTGNAAVPAALAGARVVAADLTPEMFAAGRAFAARNGVTVEWAECDVEALPYPDGAFDVVLSCVGAMFAPHHQQAADELVRVCRPGGTIALLNWTGDGFVGEVFRAMQPYAAPPPAGALPLVLWGDDTYVRGLLGDRVTEVAVQQGVLRIDRFPTPRAWRDHWKAVDGPTIAAYRHLGSDQEEIAALDRDLAAVATRFDRGTTSTVLEWEYRIHTARRVG